MNARTCFSIVLILTTGTAFGQPYAGTYTLRTPDGRLELVLEQPAEGRIEGTLTGPGVAFELAGLAAAEGIGGTVTSPTERLAFQGQLCESRDHLHLVFGQRDGSGQIRGSDAIQMTLERAQGRPITPQGAASPAGGVVINGVRLDEGTVRGLELRYNVPIPDGNYWYDKLSGAWGYIGGPTQGYSVPGLDIGGPLPEDASNGTTGVWVNGRHLHVTEVMAIQRIVGVVYPGRYWFDSQGNYGFEGFPAIANLWAIARNRGGGNEGILSTYDKTGGALIGGMFLNRDD
jgi:hypothetical protein